jgi:hypothetical protein
VLVRGLGVFWRVQTQGHGRMSETGRGRSRRGAPLLKQLAELQVCLRIWLASALNQVAGGGKWSKVERSGRAEEKLTWGACRPELTGGPRTAKGQGVEGRCFSARIPRALTTRGG